MENENLRDSLNNDWNKNLSKKRMLVSLSWIFNATVFIISVFLHMYYSDMGNWSTEAWAIVGTGSGIFKIVISAISVYLWIVCSKNAPSSEYRDSWMRARR